MYFATYREVVCTQCFVTYFFIAYFIWRLFYFIKLERVNFLIFLISLSGVISPKCDRYIIYPFLSRLRDCHEGGTYKNIVRARGWGGTSTKHCFLNTTGLFNENSQRLWLHKTCIRLSHPKCQHVLGRGPIGPTP